MIDLPGAVAVTLGVGALLYALSEAHRDGWASVSVLGAAVLGASLLEGWRSVELRSAAPLVDLSVFRNRPVTVANAVMMLKATIGVAQLFVLTLYFQNVLAYAPLDTGIAVLPMTFGSVAAAVGAGRLVSRVGVKITAVWGLILLATGLALMM